MSEVFKCPTRATRGALAAPCRATLEAISKSLPPRHVDHRHLDLIAAIRAGGIIAGAGMDGGNSKPVTADEAAETWVEVQTIMETFTG